MSRHALGPRGADDTVTMYLDIDRTSLPVVTDDGGWGGSSLTTQVWVLSLRSLRTAVTDYRLVVFGLLQPVVILLLFSQVFAGLVRFPGVIEYGSYINYLAPATMVMIAVVTALGSGAGLMGEIYSGFVGRLGTMPINVVSVLIARTVSDAVRLACQLVIAVLMAVLVLGFQPAAGGIIAAVVLSVAVGWGLSWVFIAIATWQRKAEVMQAASFIVMFPLMFGSSAYLPLAEMPGWIRALAAVNPLTYAIDATRALALGRPVGTSLVAAIALVACAAAAGGWLAARNIRRGT